MQEELTVQGNPRVLLDESFKIFENEVGFNGSLWPCEDEWKNVDKPALEGDDVVYER